MGESILPPEKFPAGNIETRSVHNPGGTKNDLMRSGPFMLRRKEQAGALMLSPRRRVLLFCLKGSAELRFGSFSFTLTPESVAAVNVGLLHECRCTAGTELLEYLPRGGCYHAYESIKNPSAFTVIPAKVQLTAWADTVASRIDAGAVFGNYNFCSIGVQLRDCSAATIPYPFSCAAGCPLWGRCAGTAGYEKAANPPAEIKSGLTQTTARKVITKLVATVGIGIWGGLLLYHMLTMIIKALL